MFLGLWIHIDRVCNLIEKFDNLLSLLVANSRFATDKVKTRNLLRPFQRRHLFQLVVSVYGIEQIEQLSFFLINTLYHDVEQDFFNFKFALLSS
jgi:hypothetical protein